MKLLLFDVDGTLVGSQTGVGRRALEVAIENVTGQKFEIPLTRCAGGTDPAIVDETFSVAGMAVGDGICDAVLGEYVRLLDGMYKPENGVFVYQGVRRLLETLAARPDLQMGLVTGNIRDGARVKLQAVDLWHFFPFGAFGSDSRDRTQLPPIAIDRARAHARVDFDPRRIYLIGDTVQDIRAGRANSLVTIALGTHAAFIPDLKAASPDYYFAGLEDLDGFLAAVAATD